MNNLSSSHISLKRALMIISLSVAIISGSSYLGVSYYNHLKKNRQNDPKYNIVAVVQTSSDSEGLKTAYFTELLELSIDNPINLYAFNSKEALGKLLASPVIKEAKIVKISPGTIWVDYSLRKPIAILGDYSNTMIDHEGVPFPIKPFFTPKILPEIFLGRLEEESSDDNSPEKKFTWGMPINGKRLRLAFSLLDFFNRHCCGESTRLERIDVSKAFALSYGQRQIVITLEDRCEKIINGKPILCTYPKMLRLCSDNYEQQMLNYMALRSYLQKNDKDILEPPNETTVNGKTMVIDLRLSDLAFFNTF